jgi:Asp-tRNA(Asn)/Glu-tRNA(Gln) amidotransferase B subunit
MEEDAGKLKHGETPETASFSYVDFNRTGVPLVEIVSGPDIRSPQEAGDYLRELRAILQYLEICTGDMEKGNFRCDANVSVRPRGQKEFGTRTELKNMNSFRHVEMALEYEIKRQISLLEDGEEVVQETFLRAYRSGEAGKVERMRAWLARIAWRLAVDLVRHRSGNGGTTNSADLLRWLPAGDRDVPCPTR